MLKEKFMKFKYSIAASAVMLTLVAAAVPVSAATEGSGVLTNDYINSREHLGNLCTKGG